MLTKVTYPEKREGKRITLSSDFSSIHYTALSDHTHKIYTEKIGFVMPTKSFVKIEIT